MTTSDTFGATVSTPAGDQDALVAWDSEDDEAPVVRSVLIGGEEWIDRLNRWELRRLDRIARILSVSDDDDGDAVEVPADDREETCRFWDALHALRDE